MYVDIEISNAFNLNYVFFIFFYFSISISWFAQGSYSSAHHCHNLFNCCCTLCIVSNKKILWYSQLGLFVSFAGTQPGY